jgi:hypothetical protein
MSETRFVTVSQFISSGQLAHRDSPFAKLDWGFNSIQPSENVMSSSWLWQALGQEEIRPRYAMGFPDEWTAFRSTAGSDKLLAKSILDLWVFQALEFEQRVFLAQLLEDNLEYRLVVAVNHLSEWKALVECEYLKKFFLQRRAFLSFLRPNHEMDPFLKPQEVLWQLKELPSEIPVLIQDFPQSQPSFFQTLKKEDIAQEMKSNHPWTLQFFKLLDRAGLGNFVLFVEAFLGFLVSYRLLRLFQAAGHFFEVDPWLHKLKQTWVIVWHRTTLKFLNYAWYRVMWKALNVIWFQGIQKPIIFIWYQLIYKPMDWTWNVLVKNIGLLFWHKVLRPTFSFVWYKLAWPTVDLFWNRICVQGWYKAVWPVLNFFWYKVIVQFWHRVVLNVVNFFWYKVLLQIWYKLIWPASNFLWHQTLVRPVLFVWYQLIYHPIDFVINVWIRRFSIIAWYRILWPTLSAAWYKGLFPTYNFLKYEVLLRSIRILRYQVLLKMWVFFRYRMVEILWILAYPLRKAYWFASFQYDKRIRYRKRYHES